jgi:hypothetical protein
MRSNSTLVDTEPKQTCVYSLANAVLALLIMVAAVTGLGAALEFLLSREFNSGSYSTR